MRSCVPLMTWMPSAPAASSMAAMRTPSSVCTPRSPSLSSTDMRTMTGKSLPASFFIAASASRTKRILFSVVPP